MGQHSQTPNILEEKASATSFCTHLSIVCTGTPQRKLCLTREDSLLPLGWGIEVLEAVVSMSTIGFLHFLQWGSMSLPHIFDTMWKGSICVDLEKYPQLSCVYNCNGNKQETTFLSTSLYLPALTFFLRPLL